MSNKNHELDCYSQHTHENPLCCSFRCWCVKQLPDGLHRLEDIEIGAKFVGTWDEKEYLLTGLTPSAAWVEVTRDKEFEVLDKKTGLKKVIRTKIRENEPWSRQTVVKKTAT